MQKISQLRIMEAKVLLDNGYYSGAYYISGYAVECALKACIAKQIGQYDFPDRKIFDGFYSHNLENLLGISGFKDELQQQASINRILDANWAIVKDWRVDSRYDIGIRETRARDLYSAVTARKNGVLSWLKKWW